MTPEIRAFEFAVRVFSGVLGCNRTWRDPNGCTTRFGAHSVLDHIEGRALHRRRPIVCRHADSLRQRLDHLMTRVGGESILPRPLPPHGA